MAAAGGSRVNRDALVHGVKGATRERRKLSTLRLMQTLLWRRGAAAEERPGATSPLSHTLLNLHRAAHVTAQCGQRAPPRGRNVVLQQRDRWRINHSANIKYRTKIQIFFPKTRTITTKNIAIKYCQLLFFFFKKNIKHFYIVNEEQLKIQ